MRISRTAPALAAVALALSAAGPAAAAGHTGPHHRAGTPDSPYELTFTSGPDTLPATFLPANTGCTAACPAALIISGSGPTDRDGNSPALPPHTDTNLNIADALAADGVASLRYDKLGSGNTDRSHHPGGAGVDFNLYAQEALDAYTTMATQPGVDKNRLVIVGHSEGALFALWLADHLKDTPLAPRAIVLAAPPGSRELDLFASQYTAYYLHERAAGQIDAATADRYVRQLHQAVETIRATGQAPTGLDDPAMAGLLNPVNTAFLAQADRYEPADLAHQLGPDEPVLVLHGTADAEISAAEIRKVMTGLRCDHAAQHYEIPQADHFFKIGTDVLDPARPFAPSAIRRLSAFVAETLF